MSFWELSVVIIVGLLVIGPARLPEAIKTGYTWLTRIKNAIHDAKKEFEHQIGADEIRRELHNEQILKSLSELKALKGDLEKTANKIHSDNHPELTETGFNNYLENEASNHLSHDNHEHDNHEHHDMYGHDDGHQDESHDQDKSHRHQHSGDSEQIETIADQIDNKTIHPEPQTKTS